jgi:endonuclease-3 related protein
MKVKDRMNKLELIYDILYKAFGPQHWWPGDTPFEVAVGAILTQNTNWGNVERAIRNIKAGKALNPKRIHAMPIAELAALIRPAGYFNVKAKRLKAFVDFLMADHQGNMRKMKDEDLPLLREKLRAVHGIGQETADSILLYAL